jgi:uncharacterized LabA/DUF88 family protein
VIGRQGVWVFSRTLGYRNRTVRLTDGTEHTFLAGEEKGIDVRIALDVIGLAHRRAYDVAVILSQDQDLAEVGEEIRVIAREQDRWIKLVCVPLEPNESQPTRDRQDGLDSDRPPAVRRVPGPARLPQAVNAFAC